MSHDSAPAAGDSAAPRAEPAFLKRLATLRESLSPAEAKVAGVVLSAPAWVLGSSLAAVAARAEVSEPVADQVLEIGS